MNRHATATCALTLLLAAAAAGCASRQPLVHVPAISMSTKSLDPGAKATAIGPVTAEYCAGDEPISTKDTAVGLMDEAVAKAEKASGASYLSDARFFTKGSCVIVEGTAMRVEGSAPSASAQ